MQGLKEITQCSCVRSPLKICRQHEQRALSMALAWGREQEGRCGCVKLVHLHVVGNIQATTVLGGALISGVGTKVEPCRGSRRP
jgi:hypothetical protein